VTGPRQGARDHSKEGLMPIDFSDAWNNGVRIVDTVISLLPNLILAIVIFTAFLIAGGITKRLIRRVSDRRGSHPSLGLLMGQLTQTSVVVLGSLIAVSVVAPSFRAGDLIKMLGVGSVAVGFAFQNILQNFLAGVLLLLHQPFHVGDRISVTGMEGRVDDIQARATVISTADGNRVVIPNALLFTSPVAVSGPENPGWRRRGGDGERPGREPQAQKQAG
jgi:small conductance mechanosensitive channel